MRGRPLKVNWQEDVDTLKQMYLHEPQVHRRTRLQALFLLHDGKSIGAVAEMFAVHYDTVQRWLNQYRAGGLSEVFRHLPSNKPGPRSRLNADQQAAVRLASRQGEFRTAADVQAYIAQHFGVAYKLSGSYSLLHRLHLSAKVPRPQAVKADAQAQAAWKKGV